MFLIGKSVSWEYFIQVYTAPSVMVGTLTDKYLMKCILLTYSQQLALDNVERMLKTLSYISLCFLVESFPEILTFELGWTWHCALGRNIEEFWFIVYRYDLSFYLSNSRTLSRHNPVSYYFFIVCCMLISVPEILEDYKILIF